MNGQYYGNNPNLKQPHSYLKKNPNYHLTNNFIPPHNNNLQLKYKNQNPHHVNKGRQFNNSFTTPQFNNQYQFHQNNQNNEWRFPNRLEFTQNHQKNTRLYHKKAPKSSLDFNNRLIENPKTSFIKNLNLNKNPNPNFYESQLNHQEDFPSTINLSEFQLKSKLPNQSNLQNKKINEISLTLNHQSNVNHSINHNANSQLNLLHEYKEDCLYVNLEEEYLHKLSRKANKLNNIEISKSLPNLK